MTNPPDSDAASSERMLRIAVTETLYNYQIRFLREFIASNMCGENFQDNRGNTVVCERPKGHGAAHRFGGKIEFEDTSSDTKQ